MAIRLMTLSEIAAEYHISQRTLFRYMQQRRLAGSKVGGKWYIPEYAVKRLFLGEDAAQTAGEVDAIELLFTLTEDGSEVDVRPVGRTRTETAQC